MVVPLSTHIGVILHSYRNQSIDFQCISIDYGFYMKVTLA